MDGGAGESSPGIEVRRSRRRRRTVAAYQDGDRVVVLIPARFTAAEEAEWVARMVKRLEARERRTHRGDADLAVRARELSRRYLGGAMSPRSVRWVGNQGSRWGSCTPADGTIRLSSRLQGMPPWVVDYVLLHELAHLAVPGHGPAFWKLLEAYPRTERARGYLEGVAATAGLDLSDTADDPADDTADDPADDTADDTADDAGDDAGDDARDDARDGRADDSVAGPVAQPAREPADDLGDAAALAAAEVTPRAVTEPDPGPRPLTSSGAGPRPVTVRDRSRRTR